MLDETSTIPIAVVARELSGFANSRITSNKAGRLVRSAGMQVRDVKLTQGKGKAKVRRDHTIERTARVLQGLYTQLLAERRAR